mgnify:CR=1 FL=1
MKKQSSSIDEKGAEEAGENRKYVRFRAWVSTGATGACRTRRNSEHHLSPAPVDFEVLNTNWHPQSAFYVTSGTLSFKFLTQALWTELLYLSFPHEADLFTLILLHKLTQYL